MYCIIKGSRAPSKQFRGFTAVPELLNRNPQKGPKPLNPKPLKKALSPLNPKPLKKAPNPKPLRLCNLKKRPKKALRPDLEAPSDLKDTSPLPSKAPSQNPLRNPYQEPYNKSFRD